MNDWLSNFPLLLYPALFLFLLAEGVGIPGLPYDVAFLICGYWIEKGVLSFWLIVLIGTIACLAGNLIGYRVGKFPAYRLARRLGIRMEEDEASMARARRLLDRYGVIIVMASRWIGPLRAPVTLGAGMIRMNLSVYFWGSLAGDLTWILAYQWLGWRASSWLARHWLIEGWKGGLIMLALGTLSTVLLLFLPVWYLRRRACRPANQKKLPPK